MHSDSSYAAEYTDTGRRWDRESGLYYYRHRMLHSQLGRFVSRDPIGYRGGDVNLQRYVHGVPSRSTDPFGTCICCCCPDTLKFTAITVLNSPTAPGYGDLLPPDSRLGLQFRVIASLKRTFTRIEGNAECTIKWYECSDQGGDQGQRPGQWWTPPDVHGTPPEAAISNWCDPYTGPCPGSYERYWQDAPSIFNSRNSRTNIKFAVRVGSDTNCLCRPKEVTLYFRLNVRVVQDNQLDWRQVVFDPTPPHLIEGINEGEPRECNESNIPWEASNR